MFECHETERQNRILGGYKIKFEAKIYKRLGAIIGSIIGVFAMIISVCVGENILGAGLLILCACIGVIGGNVIEKRMEID